VSFTVLRVPSVTRVVEHDMTKRERRAYDAAVDALRGEGCWRALIHGAAEDEQRVRQPVRVADHLGVALLVDHDRA
jgi:hypothetical protein